MQTPLLTSSRLQELAGKLEQNQSLVQKLQDTIKHILQNHGYQAWFHENRLLKKSYKLPDDVTAAMEELGLSDDGYLHFEVHRLLDSIFITDLPALDRRIAVYPFTNESEDIHEYLAENDLYAWQDSVCDLFCGCGHHIIAGSSNMWPRHIRRVGFDINERALAYARINAVINNVKVDIMKHDIGDTLPIDYIGGRDKKVLFLANAPFFLAPISNVLPPTIDGGETGAALTFKALEAIKQFWQSSGAQVRAIILAYTVGRSPAGDWEVMLKAQQLFGKENVQFKLLTNKKIIRVGGINTLQVPAAVEEIRNKSDCKLDIRDELREEVRKGYDNLVETLRMRNWTHVGYGIISIDLPTHEAV